MCIPDSMPSGLLIDSLHFEKFEISNSNLFIYQKYAKKSFKKFNPILSLLFDRKHKYLIKIISF